MLCAEWFTSVDSRRRLQSKAFLAVDSVACHPSARVGATVVIFLTLRRGTSRPESSPQVFNGNARAPPPLWEHERVKVAHHLLVRTDPACVRPVLALPQPVSTNIPGQITLGRSWVASNIPWGCECIGTRCNTTLAYGHRLNVWMTLADA
eukprot:9504185-Pyramimonas_sp.AAC.4